MSTSVPMRFEDTPLLWTAAGIYSESECARICEDIAAASPSLATNNPMYRNQDRVMRDDPETTADLFGRLRAHLPERIGELTLVGLNERLRYYRYREGQRFEPHMDHWYQPSETRITLLTVLVYFNDDFEGGETRFMEQVEQTVVPAPGLAAIFQHKIRHEGCEVRRGTKYALRTDALYEASTPIQLLR
ncbi:MAG: 2OG-Fe(II) oxygenase [Sandaracinaceae bacterium]